MVQKMKKDAEGEVMETEDSILDRIRQRDSWLQFLYYKIEHQNLRREEEKQIWDYIENERYQEAAKQIEAGSFPGEYPVKKTLNKEGTNKKRIVYSFIGDTSITLKFIAFYLYKFDDMFGKNCYAFRRTYGVGDAIGRISRNPAYMKKYCFKADISNYFNSIDTEFLLEKLEVVREWDKFLYGIFENILLEEHVQENGRIITEKHGAMAGIPIAPFFANIYLSEVDMCFTDREYFRYSDDILLFADTYEELLKKKEQLYRFLSSHYLKINKEKESLAQPGESWEFLGFSYESGLFDLSKNTRRKMKAKIKRKADALRRWQRKKGLSGEKAAIGFIRAMNYKFYGKGDGEGDEFTWSRWFFPNLTTDAGLKEIDRYMQEYIRYAVTGRHYKGNYRISYEKMKEWGYRSLVHEYYKYRKGKNRHPSK